MSGDLCRRPSVLRIGLPQFLWYVYNQFSKSWTPAKLLKLLFTSTAIFAFLGIAHSMGMHLAEIPLQNLTPAMKVSQNSLEFDLHSNHALIVLVCNRISLRRDDLRPENEHRSLPATHCNQEMAKNYPIFYYVSRHGAHY